MRKFYRDNRFVFYLENISTTEEYTEPRSNIPSELIMECIDKIDARLEGRLSFYTTTEDYIGELGALILEHEYGQFFFFPDYVLSNGDLITEKLEQLIKLSSSLPVHDGEYFSSNFNQDKFYALNVLYHRIRLYYPEDFEVEFITCQRKDYENYITCEQAKHDYINSYAADNLFYKVEEEDYSFVFLVDEEHLYSVISI